MQKRFTFWLGSSGLTLALCCLYFSGIAQNHSSTDVTLAANYAEAAQKVSIRPLKEVLTELHKTYGLQFSYKSDIAQELKLKVPASLSKEKDIEVLLTKVLAPSGLKYKKVKKVYIIYKDEKPESKQETSFNRPEVNAKASQADIEVTGRVTDESGTGLPGVTVLLQGTSTATPTGSDGSYAITVPDGNGTLVFSYIGYQTQEVPINNRTSIDVVLEDDAKALEEVVVVGYGTQKKANLTGAVDQVGGEVFENRPLPNITQGLQGVLPNVNIRLLDGKPNASPNINIRGTTSIGQGGSALVLIDGVEGDPSMLNPNDIESISVLKDASSAAVYGARGAFGVVLITTKRPASGAFSITYNANFGVKQPTVLPDYVTDGFLWASMFNESFYAWEGTYPQNVNKTLTFSQEYLAELERRSKDPSLPKIEVGPDGKYVYYGNTDWYDLLYKDQLYSNEHNISLSRSTDKASFMVSGRYYGQEGLFRYNSDDFKGYNLRARGSIELYPWLQVNNNFDYSGRSYHNPLNVGEGGGIWRNIADEGHVLAPMLNPDGTLTYSAAYTVGDFYYGKNGIDTKRNIIRNTTGFEAQVVEDKFKIIGNFTFQNINNNEFRRRVQVPYSTAPGVIEYVGTEYNDIRNIQDETDYIAANLYGEYENTFRDKHYLKAMAGTNYEQSTFERLLAQRNGLIFEDASNINLALGQSIVTSGGYEKWKILGGFYRLNYIFDDRYLLELNGRYDGSSKFPEDERYAFFPSVSAGWRISEESFWPVPADIVSQLKLRASYGSLGSGNIGAYAFQETFSISQSDRILNGIQPQRTSMPDVLPNGLTWETVTTQNIGLDLGMFSGKLQFSGDAYIRKATDMYTIGMTLPAVFGATSPKGNYADLKTTGWELMLSWRDMFQVASKPFNYQVRLNLADNQAEILRYNNPNKFLNDYYEGMKIGEIWGYETEGFFTSQADIDNHADQSLFKSTSSGEYFPGDIKLRDINGDGIISPGDNTVDNPGDRAIIGNSAPRYTYGINLGADWNNFFFSAFFQGVGKQDWYPRYDSNAFWGQYNRPYGDIPKWHLEEGIIWSEDNPDSFFPRYVSRLANRNGAILREEQSGYVMNAAYVRLKNFQVGYNLPLDLISRIKLKAARIYVSGDNLWTWSPLYKIVKNIDVENATAPSDQLFTSSNAGDGYNYPLLRSYTLGLSVTF
ncbi:TonB-dependent receptor [Pontibacter sp. 172403-2]|uniref:SusC/RagA family TonB-linked outer membrane protein n=1 Tax=Pontibacter rufus TaxID=2791028 RepID=UPI0018AFB554|nr:TonB-dependent receptor [Pontibacter sp. 172403-2]MBF9254482.1 TonB-dependent receptor [Pontibacter sp. 172403-2]